MIALSLKFLCVNAYLRSLQHPRFESALAAALECKRIRIFCLWRLRLSAAVRFGGDGSDDGGDGSKKWRR